ncbi:MAG: GIY-YIG nuclease family protein [Fusobacterium polymorphum]
MIKFTDFIKDFTDGKESKIKCKFHMSTDFLGLEKSPYDCLMEDDIDWQNLNNYRNEKGKSSRLDGYDYLVSFAQYNIYGRNFFVFGGVYKVEIAKPEHYEIGGYNISLLDNKDPIGEFLNKYRKRLIVKLDENLGINFELTYEAIEKKNIEVFEVFPNIASGKFNGYQNVSITHKELREIVSNNKLSWKLALSYIKAVYVITDTKTGKLYIGSASGNSQGLWQRWECYADFRDLIGENKEFENLVNKNGRNYIQDNFKYSILEIFDTKTRQEYILERENYWKNVFETKKFGMNKN